MELYAYHLALRFALYDVTLQHVPSVVHVHHGSKEFVMNAVLLLAATLPGQQFCPTCPQGPPQAPPAVYSYAPQYNFGGGGGYGYGAPSPFAYGGGYGYASPFGSGCTGGQVQPSFNLQASPGLLTLGASAGGFGSGYGYGSGMPTYYYPQMPYGQYGYASAPPR